VEGFITMLCRGGRKSFLKEWKDETLQDFNRRRWKRDRAVTNTDIFGFAGFRNTTGMSALAMDKL
jgi:hypothetical protein